MNIDLTQIILAVIALISAVLTGFVIPLLKAKLLSEESKLSDNQQNLLMLAINTAVRAAEQLYNSDEGQKKKAYVLSVLQSQGYKVDSTAIDTAIESAVLTLHRNLNG